MFTRLEIYGFTIFLDCETLRERLLRVAYLSRFQQLTAGTSFARLSIHTSQISRHVTGPQALKRVVMRQSGTSYFPATKTRGHCFCAAPRRRAGVNGDRNRSSKLPWVPLTQSPITESTHKRHMVDTELHIRNADISR